MTSNKDQEHALTVIRSWLQNRSARFFAVKTQDVYDHMVKEWKRTGAICKLEDAAEAVLALRPKTSGSFNQQVEQTVKAPTSDVLRTMTKREAKSLHDRYREQFLKQKKIMQNATREKK